MAISKQTKLTDYEGFVEKFVPKKTTDDCYTPQAVYDEVLRFVGEITDTKGREIVRPFWPGGDYERYDYPDNCIVVDNPPFSIYSSVVRFYLAHHIDFFLFAPTLTQTVINTDCCHIIVGVNVTYENGAQVNTSFTTSLCKDRVWCCPDLFNRLNKLNPPKDVKTTIDFPDHVVTPAMLSRLTKLGIEFKFSGKESAYICEVDNYEKSLFGRGWLLSDGAAMRRAEADKRADEIAQQEKAAKVRHINLSYREKAIIDILNKQTENTPTPLLPK